jgi:DNA (cytosine-5)-methyltransferase 1
MKIKFVNSYFYPMKEIRVIELFAGVGGFRLGLEGWQGKSASSHYQESFDTPFKVIWSNQWEPSSARCGEFQEANTVYHRNWQDSTYSIHYPYDLNTVASPNFTDKKVNGLIPDHDMLVGGFPCQDYSVAGVNTKGIEGKKGVLWWNIHKILKVKKPKFVFLENVDRLLKSPSNNRGRDFAIMLATFNDLGYSVEWKVINAADYGMPQRRRRVYILAYNSKSKLKIKNSVNWIESEGVFAKSFPGVLIGETKEIFLDSDIQQLSDSYKNGKFLNCGVMVNGKVLMSDFKAKFNNSEQNSYSKQYHLLGDVLLNKEMIELSYYVDSKKKLKEPLFKILQTGFAVDSRLVRQGDVIELYSELEKWIYLKGRKSEERRSSKGIFYYKEGPLSLVDDINKPSRTIITSEGGPGASRFKHLIQIDDKYRRLHPIELERLNMFPDNHTAIGLIGEQEFAINPAKRAFFMGNALVVGVVERVGIELNKKLKDL